ncbi:MAG: PAS domain S-box protein [Promethearchaeota archaeon]
MNEFALFSLLSAVVSIFLGSFVFSKNSNNWINRLFMIFCLSQAYWAITEFGYRSATEFHIAAIWLKMNSLWPLTIVFLLHFVLVFTEQINLLRNKLTYLLMYAPALIIVYLDLTVFSGEPMLTYWGWTYRIPENFMLFIVSRTWGAGLGILAFCLCLQYYIKSIDLRKKKQAKYVSIGISFPVLLGIVTEWLLPSIQIRIPEFTASSTVLGSFFIGYAIIRHELFILSPSTAADSVIDTMSDAFFLVSPEGKIISVNLASIQLLEYKENEIIQMPLENILINKNDNPGSTGCVFDNLIKAGNVNDVEMNIKTKNGHLIPISLSSSIMHDNEDNLVGIVLIGRDITERKQIEKKITSYTENLEKLVEERTKAFKESEERLTAILTGIGDIIGIHNKDLDVIWINQAARGLYGDIVGKKCYMAYKGLTKPCPECTVEAVFNEGKTVVTEQSHMNTNGTNSNVLVTSSPVRNAEGNIFAVVEVAKDITELKNLETQLKDYTENLENLVEERTKALSDSEEKQKAILAGIGDLITIQNEKLDIIWANESTQDIWGDVIGKKCYETYKGFDKPCPECTVETVFTEGQRFASEQTVRRLDGSWMNTLVTSSPMKDAEGNVVAVVETIKDITGRKELENALKDSEERYRGLYDSSIDGIISLDSEGHIIECNQAFAEMVGYRKEELRDINIFNITPKRWYKASKENHRQLLELGYAEEFEKEYIKKDGTTVPVAIRGWPIKNQEGEIIGIWGIIRDITAQKQAEEKIKEYTENLERIVEQRTSDLKDSEERYRGLYESSIDGIVSTDLEGNIIDCNQALADMIGYTKQDLNKMNLFELTPKKWHAKISKIIKNQIIQRGYSDEFETEGIRNNGVIFPVSTRSWVIKDQEGKAMGMWAIVQDITEKKKMEKIKSQFINLAAHELRTPLSAMKAHVELLKIKSEHGYWELPNEVHDKIKIITRNADRLAALINNLLDYTRLEAGTRKIKQESGSLDTIIGQVINEVLPIAKIHGHTLELHSPNQLPQIQIDEDMIRSVFTNLLSNAIKYTPDGGMIEVKILEEEFNLHVSVKDTGIGIPENEFEKIFQPFHVTDLSESSRLQSEFARTGLGLAISKEYVKLHGGSIWVESKVGEGSTFHVVLPKTN